MPFCPTCRMEFRAGFDRCNDCGSGLVDELPPGADQHLGEIALARLAVFQTTAEARMIREILEDGGITCALRGARDPIGAPSGADPIALYVEAHDLERARALFTAYFDAAPLADSGTGGDAP